MPRAQQYVVSRTPEGGGSAGCAADTVWLGDATISSAAAALPTLKGFGTIVDLRVQMTDDAVLLAAVEDFVTLSSSTSWSDLRADVEGILFRWAGVDGVAPVAMGPAFDRQKLAFLEEWFGVELTPRDGFGDPMIANASELADAWNAALDAATVRLAAQGPLAEFFPDVAYDVASDRLEASEADTLAQAIALALADAGAARLGSKNW